MTKSTFSETANPLRRILTDSMGQVGLRAMPLMLAWLVSNSFVAAEEFQISLRGGSVITVDVAEDAFAWTKVMTNGEMVKEPIKFANVQQLVLSDSPASEQVSEIRRWISMLGSDDYLQRQMAEEELSKPDVGGNFKAMIKSQAQHPAYEVRYRIARILDNLDSDEINVTTSEFDRLVLKDGTVAEGDAGNFRLDCTYRGRSLIFSRDDIRVISVPVLTNPIVAAGVETQVQMFHLHGNDFYLPHQTTIDFEQAPNGSEIRRHTNVNEMFTATGLKLGTEQEGFIGISGYGFKFPDKPATGNSVCVFESVGTYSKRFKGVMELTFCMPNQTSVPAGVNEIGLLMARVNHSRDFLMEAYNANGQILASVEASDQPCVFTGVKSNEPIAKVRILSNPYLFRIDRAVDEDFAVDNICFSAPVPITGPTGTGQPTVRLNNGDLIQGDSIKIMDDNSISIDVPNNDPIQVALSEVRELNFARKPAEIKQKKAWIAMLKDRSTLLVTPDKTFTSSTFPFLNFKPDELIGLWSSQNPARFPEASDFEQGKMVIVFPTCRIAANSVDFTNTGFTWEKSAKKLIQPLQIDSDQPEDEDPTPKISAVQYEKAWPENIPTIWIQAPRSQLAGTGRMSLSDGQQLVLSEGTGFQLAKLDDKEVTILVAGQNYNIPLAEVLSIEFPGKRSP